MPHIVATSERAAWYALGYEQARDGLLWIQYACKAAKGELTWVRGRVTVTLPQQAPVPMVDASGLTNDLAVQLLGASLRGMSVSNLRTLFASSSTQVNFYDNCVAFADGVNAYRQAVATSLTQGTPEYQLKTWLDTHALPSNPGGQPNLHWVYAEAVDPVDIASQGGWTAAFWSFLGAEMQVVNSIGSSYTFQGGGFVEPVDPDPVVDVLAPGLGAALMGQIRHYASSVPGAPSAMCGSNTFAWAHGFCRDSSTSPPTFYAGLLADPHQGRPFHGADFPGQFKNTPNHMWFAHVQVTPLGASTPTLDVFGHVPYAAAAFQSCHNRNIAMGGTAGAPNHTDHFVVRLKEAANGGLPDPALLYYSYYHDTFNSNNTYQPLTVVNCTILRDDGVAVPVHCWRAGSFGVALPNLLQLRAYVAAYDPSANPQPVPHPGLPVVYGERVDDTSSAPPPRWSVNTRTNPPKSRYWATPQTVNGVPMTSPMLVTLRSPMDLAVAGNPQGASSPQTRSEARHWLMLRDFWELNHADSVWDVPKRTNSGALNVNVCFADRYGGTFTTQLSSIPKRGVDQALANDGYTSLDKVAFYSGFAGPVPARHHLDRMFDWQFGSSGTADRPAPLEYLDYNMNGQGVPVDPPIIAFKPYTLQVPALNLRYPPTRIFPASSQGPWAIESGWFASATNDAIWGYSRKRDENGWLGPVSPPMFSNLVTPKNDLLQHALDLGCAYQSSLLGFEGVDRHQIVVEQFTRQAEYAYTNGSSGLPPMTPTQMREFVVAPKLHVEAGSPVAIRQLQQVLASGTDPENPLNRAQKELEFFSDLWDVLTSPLPVWTAKNWANYVPVGGTGVSLRSLWVDRNDPNHLDQIFWYDDPNNPAAPRWIDMPPSAPLIDFVWSDSDLGHGLTTGAALSSGLMSGPELADFTSLVGLLANWDLGTPAADRFKALPTSSAACLYEMMRKGYDAKGQTYGRKWRPMQSGVPQQLEAKDWKALEGIAFPVAQMATLMPGGLNPPYDALYSNVPGRNVRTAAQLLPSHVNELVKFFLQLGSHYIDPVYNNGNPSRKFLRSQLAGGSILPFLPATYPLTGGLERLAVLRRLLDTRDYLLGGLSNSSLPPMSQCFRTRAFDYNGSQLWPVGAQDSPCVGGGLRSVDWVEDAGDQRYRPSQGFQPLFIGAHGSYATLLAMFPLQGANQGSVESYFWCTPGVQAMGPDLRGPTQTSARFNAHMNAYATNSLLPSYYSNFLSTFVSMVTHVY
ncbi:MAG: penicillin acylase family protein [Planctomycetes bacterium]|nr:penicillin acylase family protein [Planctomycetota bacterium]